MFSRDPRASLELAKTLHRLRIKLTRFYSFAHRFHSPPLATTHQRSWSPLGTFFLFLKFQLSEKV
jgi:hypothetical protein